MDKNINTIDSQYTSSTVDYNDADLSTVISNLKATITSLENVKAGLTGMVAYESTWKGKSKATYGDLKHFLTLYQEDYLSSVKKLKETATGLETLLEDIPSATVLKEIDNA
ncbi:hypothetical protein ACVR05_02150 [Streptococcus caprae]|uniref:WXG100 family type VII secretion target n=1 Tax=Streptococcus caprae TaxID=1640501 RepID=A0ABV8CWS7_9STRE